MTMQKHSAAVKKRALFKIEYQFATKWHVLGKSVDGARGMGGTMMATSLLQLHLLLQLLGTMTVMSAMCSLATSAVINTTTLQ